MFTLRIAETTGGGSGSLPIEIERLKMAFDQEPDINAVIALLTKRPRAKRKDAGTKRQPEQ